MKRLFLILLTLTFGLSQIQAIPAEGRSAKVKQPDGTELTIRLVGDEFLHFNVTEDGYSVVRDERGYYVYARQNDEGQLVPTSQIAHEEPMRSSAEKAFLATTQKYLQPKMTEAIAKVKNEEYALRRKAAEKHRAPKYDYTKFRGLVILVEYNDCEFNQENYKEIITDMITQEDFTGYYDYRNQKINCTGSVVDYFRDNSMGVFVPQFDIVGPVQIDRSKYFPEGTDYKNLGLMMAEIINEVDKTVNFKNYDGDKDGQVDMVYFIFAGHGSHVTGNNAGLVWPHASSVYGWNEERGYAYYIDKDGVRLNRYACSTELSGRETSRDLDGIGTICHEFSHVLGLPDFYDTDYAKSGGQSADPDSWSLMAQGGYLNSSRTPAGYSLFERYMVGFATPEVINEEGSYTLDRLNESNTGYRINTPVKREYFILENRQKTRWDAYLPGHGLLVFRVDSTNTSVWSNNTLNANPKHNYYELVRAKGKNATAGNDPFPGSGKVTTLNNVTTPANLKTWAGKETQFGLLNITEKGGVITFDIENTYILRELTMPETFTTGLGITKKIAVKPVPTYAIYTLTWSSADESIAIVSQDGTIHGISEGETTITVESDNGLKASCKLTVETLQEADEIANFKTFDEEKESILNLHEAQVLYIHDTEKNIYVRDASGAIILNQTGLKPKQGDLISGKIVGKLKIVNKMPRFVFIQNEGELTITSGNAPAARHTSIEKLSEADYADFIVVDTVALLRSDGSVFAIDNDSNKVAKLFNVFGIKNITIPSNIDNKRFNLRAIYGTHPTGGKIINELYILEAPTEDEEWTPIDIVLTDEIEKKYGNSDIYNLQGQKLSSLKKGVNIVGGKKIVVP